MDIIKRVQIELMFTSRCQDLFVHDRRETTSKTTERCWLPTEKEKKKEVLKLAIQFLLCFWVLLFGRSCNNSIHPRTCFSKHPLLRSQRFFFSHFSYIATLPSSHSVLRKKHKAKGNRQWKSFHISDGCKNYRIQNKCQLARQSANSLAMCRGLSIKGEKKKREE